jgi:hypothetical protein
VSLQDPARKKATDEQTDMQICDRKRRKMENLQTPNMEEPCLAIVNESCFSFLFCEKMVKIS